ncbi:MAG TPA: transposase [Steroidobacteraceae bacterium]|nr:transposase [Steroidobacteraceae bacterium]
MQLRSKTRGAVRYTPEFKQQVLAKLNAGEMSLRKVSREFGVSLPTLIKWRKEEGSPHPRIEREQLPNSPLMLEIGRLQAEIAQLRAERDQLRRGIAYLAGVPVKE